MYIFKPITYSPFGSHFTEFITLYIEDSDYLRWYEEIEDAGFLIELPVQSQYLLYYDLYIQNEYPDQHKFRFENGCTPYQASPTIDYTLPFMSYCSNVNHRYEYRKIYYRLSRSSDVFFRNKSLNEIILRSDSFSQTTGSVVAGYSKYFTNNKKTVLNATSNFWEEGEQVETNTLELVEHTALSNWEPSEISTLLWLDASDDTTITKNASNEVTIWEDKSGNSNNMAGIDNPVTGASTQNSLNVIDLDGGDYFELDAFTTPTSGNLQAFIVCNVTEVTNSADSILAMDASSNSWQLQAGRAGSFQGKLAFSDQTTASTAVGGINLTGYHIFCADLDFTDDGQYRILLDGELIADEVSYDSKLASVVDFRVFANRGENQFPKGSVAEVILIDSTSNSDREKVEGYLAHKWNLETELPEDHVFKSNPPTVMGASSYLPSSTKSGNMFYGASPLTMNFDDKKFYESEQNGIPIFTTTAEVNKKIPNNMVVHNGIVLGGFIYWETSKNYRPLLEEDFIYDRITETLYQFINGKAITYANMSEEVLSSMVITVRDSIITEPVYGHRFGAIDVPLYNLLEESGDPIIEKFIETESISNKRYYILDKSLSDTEQTEFLKLCEDYPPLSESQGTEEIMISYYK